ncbi:hypothetical protein F2Q69_00004015 [Brassica cretica]|uniref:Uncharacterized protein n=1 Tax=Brassica cretica TaxID=69181 RepID=A0A8S9P7V8_BRACR|nr:hypothetical protein F2Q69_00004015 [Brassica cretica]
MLSVFVSESRRIANDGELWRRKGIAFLDLCGGGRRFSPELQARSEATVDFLVFERERIENQSEPKETHALLSPLILPTRGLKYGLSLSPN